MNESWEQPPFLQHSGESRYRILVEYSSGGESKPPMVIKTLPEVYDRLEDATAAALEQARNFAPPDPWAPKGRTVYRLSEREYLALVQGLTATFPVTVRVGEEIPLLR